jgi:hypothetical protein
LCGKRIGRKNAVGQLIQAGYAGAAKADEE